MPGLSYSLPAWECKTGSKLRKVPGSPCYGCYALKGNYTRYPAIKAAQYRRLEAIKHPEMGHRNGSCNQETKIFLDGMMQAMYKSEEHMQKIIEVCKLTPDTKHWLPTQERAFLPAPEDVPANLVIRLSRSKIDGPAGSAWSHDSGVTTDETKRTCPAPTQGGKCLDCRACWNQSLLNLLYTGSINARTFKHPKYYKELRERNKLDQAISGANSTEQVERAPDPGHKRQAALEACGLKLEACRLGLDASYSFFI